MVAAGHVGRADDAFRRYLGAGRAGHVAAEWPALAQIVAWIRDAGGVATLAHPARYTLSSGARKQLLTAFAAAGGTALEVVTGGNGAQHSETCAVLAVQFGLSGSIGSDFHNPQLTWNPLGRLAKLPDCIVPVWRGHL
jgi:3',5'-nucleoside bisphosphate phosphatase